MYNGSAIISLRNDPQDYSANLIYEDSRQTTDQEIGAMNYMRFYPTSIIKKLLITTQMALLGSDQSIRLVYQTGSDHSTVHDSIHASHPVQKQSQSSCPV